MAGLVGRLTDYTDPGSVGSRLRRRRARLLTTLLDGVHPTQDPIRVLDLGGTRAYWDTIGRSPRRRTLEVTLVNVGVPQAPDGDGFRHLQGDACDLPDLADGSFDLVHSNSVIEHVGDWERMEAFAREARRLGRLLFVQTPNYWFPVEPHFGVPLFHWLPEPVRIRLLMRFDLGHFERAGDVAEATWAAQSARLLTKAQLHHLFPDAAIHVERIGPFAKSLIAVRTG